ncbi:lipocalin family protein [Chitinophaga agri]|uniref:Outer membrane lipoprotein Blc n=1 Tax=Chitinophaga agri TaxID=2703787 RepID=A0A6B9ZME2_9BACT|nr:lipocalin family protein [Chitinophaga agri]QHS63630.1 lipocalin [Chitinophaga agri]
MVKIHKVHVALLAGAGLLMLSTATAVTIPKGAVAVRPFYVDKFLGKWYEIARLDYKYEEDLNNVTATYSLRKDGAIRVDNRGYDYTKNKWKESIGKAKFAREEDMGRLKVSFFGPFYAGYNVIAIDREYKYALIAGNNLKYMWILSRETTIPDHVKESYLAKAREIGYDTDALVWCEHDGDQE